LPPGPFGRHANASCTSSELSRHWNRSKENVDPADLMKREIEARALGH